jgi:hypothetical protein
MSLYSNERKSLNTQFKLPQESTESSSFIKSGFSLAKVLESCQALHASRGTCQGAFASDSASVRFCTMLEKPDPREESVPRLVD